MDTHRYQEALDYLYSFVDYSVQRSFRYSEDAFDLSRVAALLDLLGNPHTRFPSIHIAGTKGKGSVASLVASALRTAGYRTGKYISPHLIRFTERIQVDGQEIPPETVADLVARLRPAVEKIAGLTTYELITAMAFMHYADQAVDCAVVEVGLGGRLDATNVLQPVVAVITSLSYDHMHLLGNSLSEIAGEKAGIIKPFTPVVVAPQQIEAMRVVQAVAEQRAAPQILVGQDWLFAPGSRDLDHQSLFIWSSQEQALMDSYVESGGDEEWAPPRYEIPLLGYHQVINAAVAYAALKTAAAGGLPIEEAAIRKGFRQVSWPARFQVISNEPVVVVDCAHNRDSALKLRIALDDYFPGQPVTLVYGASEDKDIEGMFAELVPRVSRVILTQALHPRAAEPQTLAEMARSYGMRVECIIPVDDAIEHAIAQARPDEVVLAAGSVFIAGEVLRLWEERMARQPTAGASRAT